MNKHGHMKLSWQGDLFIVEVEGPFNEEGIEFWFSELKKSVENSRHKVWRRLEVWNDEVIGSPKTMETGAKIYEWYENNGCDKVAIVISNGFQEQVLQQMDNDVKIFRDKETAEKWFKITL